MSPANDNAACTDCNGSGITNQTERPCSCLAPFSRIYFPAQDEYVVIGHLPDGRYTAHLEDAIGTARGRGSTMLEAIADLVEVMGREECN